MRNQRVVVASVMAVFGLLGLLGYAVLKEPSSKMTVVQSAQGQALVFNRSSSGHYRWRGQLGGVETEFLIDTGAVRTTIPKSLADQARLQLVERSEFSTASGKVPGGIASTTLALRGGLRIDALRVAVIPEMGTQPLLGMDVISQLRVEIANDQMKVWLPKP